MKRAFDSHVRSHRRDVLLLSLDLPAAPPLVPPVVDAPLIPLVNGPPLAPEADAVLPQPGGAAQIGPQGDHEPAVENNANVMPSINEVGAETAYSVVADVDLLGMSCSIGSAYNLDFLDAMLD